MSQEYEAEISLTVCGLLSMVSTLALLIYYAVHKKSRTYGFRLVIPLFVFDFIWSLNIIWPTLYYYHDPDFVLSEPLCRIQATIKLFAMLASFFCTATISWSLFSFIVLKRPIQSKNPSQYYAKYTIVLPLFLSIVPLAFDRYDHLEPLSNIMCFIVVRSSSGSIDYVGILLRIFFYDFPFLIVLFFDLYAAIKIATYFRNNFSEIDKMRSVKNIMLYPLVLFLSWIWIIIQRFAELVQDQQIEWLNNVDLGLATLNGFLNAIVYGYISLDPFGFFRKKKQDTESLIESQDSQIVSNQKNNAVSLESKVKESESQYDCTLLYNYNPNQDSSSKIIFHESSSLRK